MPEVNAKGVAWTVAGTSFLFLYWRVLLKLAADWAHDDNYSHGFVIVPFALYFAWERRGRLLERPASPSVAGLGIVAVGLATLLIGQLGAELFLTRVSSLVVIVGGLAFIRGWRAVRVMALPLAFLVLMIPIPAIIFNQIAFPLQLMASAVGEVVLSMLKIPVLREGNLIVLANTTLEVAEACSGIRSLISLLTLGIIAGYFLDHRTPVRWVVALATVPIAILANGIRVAGTGVAAHYMGERAAQGFLHTFSSWLMFLIASLMLFLIAITIQRLWPESRGPAVVKVLP